MYVPNHYIVVSPYSKPEGRRSDSGVETGTESGMMGSGLRKGVRQRSFFEDEYSTATGEVGVNRQRSVGNLTSETCIRHSHPSCIDRLLHYTACCVYCSCMYWV